MEIFLKKKRTSYTNKVLIQENLPRSYLSEVDKKKKILKKKISKKYFNKLLMLEKNYMKNF